MKTLKLSILIPAIALCVSVGASAEEPGSDLALNKEGLVHYWVPEKRVAPKYPGKSIRMGEEGCVAVGFVIESDGTTSSHRVIASFPSENFDSSAIEAAEQFTYKPAEINTNREATFSTNTFTFQLSDAGKEQRARERKALSDICNKEADKVLNTDAGTD